MLYNILHTLEPKDWLNIVLAILGIIISAGGLIIAIRQICKMRDTSVAVHDEVIKSQKHIRQTLDSNEIGRAIKNIEQAIGFVSIEDYEHALSKMMDVKSMIENEEVINIFLSPGDLVEFNFQKHRFNKSFKIVAADVKEPGNIDRRIVQSCLSEIHSYLLKIENKIKASVYERKY